MSNREILSQIIDFLGTLTGQDGFTAETDLMAAGVTDSLTMMDLLVWIESEFQVRLGFTDLTPEVFETPRTLATLIAERSGGQALAA